MYVHVVLLNGKCQVIFMSSYAFFFSKCCEWLWLGYFWISWIEF
jgi:hypothetical protein